MNEQMPAMPSAVTDNSTANTLEVNVLPVPNNDESPAETSKVEIKDPSKTNSEVNIPVVGKKGISVTATRKGFFSQQRIKSGAKFIVPKFEQLGCI